ncbi:unnamed protein product [Clonostachys rhizophaga]|uniref:Uncharacterized protein n=1 Tax=Clonostachys rhizophaga TaxID=160324 RepID=A0A9N9VBF9_9HYPO|nr:unnamed protein product [Clonostachys rhizophaga]
MCPDFFELWQVSPQYGATQTATTDNFRTTQHIASTMPASQGNHTGSSGPKAVPHGAWDFFPSEPFPLYDSTKSVIYLSEYGKTIIGMLREKRKDTLVCPVDEFLFVTQLSLYGAVGVSYGYP